MGRKLNNKFSGQNLSQYTGLDNCISECFERTEAGATKYYSFTNAGDSIYFLWLSRITSNAAFGLLFTQSLGAPRLVKFLGGAVTYTNLATT